MIVYIYTTRYSRLYKATYCIIYAYIQMLFNIICNHFKIGSLLLSLGDVPLRQFQGLHWLVVN